MAQQPLQHGSVGDLVEAAVRTGRFDEAKSAHGRLEARARAVGADLALGVRARSAALIADGADAEAGYLEAIDRLGRGGADVLLARTHLVYGEWLRRQERRVEARAQLRRAHELFVAIGAPGLAERARREIDATGETSQTAVHGRAHAAGVGGSSARRRGPYQPRDR